MAFEMRFLFGKTVAHRTNQVYDERVSIGELGFQTILLTDSMAKSHVFD